MIIIADITADRNQNSEPDVRLSLLESGIELTDESKPDGESGDDQTSESDDKLITKQDNNGASCTETRGESKDTLVESLDKRNENVMEADTSQPSLPAIIVNEHPPANDELDMSTPATSGHSKRS